ncbi:winged helix-turn-helix domain-containing protein [Rubrivivax rivuli]|uniref:Response regulator transcription factor n=1 Tax=Rubrivivax rivuli TaxID=1862385 RepID=A0A437RAU1_9BURK|nr:winged helix-turn-helix domain-containing protein [Rubrivivax rivuli]RVU43889.1 response regulator transcription factor [Rubrivivax rivuli]
MQAARLAGLQPVMCVHPEQALERARAARAEMVLVQEAALQSDAAATLALLRTAGPLRVVLVGPEFGSFNHGRALRLGYDEVWPADTPVALLALMLGKAHGRAPAQVSLATLALAAVAPSAGPPPTARTPTAAPAAPPAPPRLQVDLRTGSCRWGGQVVQLTRGSAALLQGLQRAHPQGVTRAQLAQVLIELSGSQAAGLCPEGRQRRVDTQVSRLRAELAAGGLGALRIASVRFMGYRLVLPP